MNLGGSFPGPIQQKNYNHKFSRRSTVLKASSQNFESTKVEEKFVLDQVLANLNLTDKQE